MIFENSYSKGIFRQNIRNSTKWSLKCSSRFLQAAALKDSIFAFSGNRLLPIGYRRLIKLLILNSVCADDVTKLLAAMLEDLRNQNGD